VAKNNMNPKTVRRKTIFYLLITTLLLGTLVPFAFFVTTAFTSTYDMYKFPKTIMPRMSYNFKVTFGEQEKKLYKLYIEQKDKTWEAVYSSGDFYGMKKYMKDQLNVIVTEDTLEKDLSPAKTKGEVYLKYKKDMIYNFKQFFLLTSGATEALVNSIKAALWTVAISLFFGSLSGYAIARCKFKGKKTYSISLLFVRMFPAIAVAIPMIILVMKLGLYDTMLALGVVYSIPNIALTAWITNSIFSGIGVELEEASMVFGANRIQTFCKITLPLAIPGMVASSMYAFLTAWNDSITALVMTNQNQTLSLLIYKTIGTSSSSSLHIAAAGAIILLIPSLIFTYIVKNYISQLWGNTAI